VLVTDQDPTKVTRRNLRFGVIAAVFVAVAAIPLVRTQLQPEPDPDADADAVRPVPTTTVVAPDIGHAGTPIVYDMDFLDERHGFALWGRCTDGRDYQCERRLLVTEDGVNWTSQGFDDAQLAAPERLAGRIIVLGPGRLMLTESNNRYSPNRFYSDDGGRSWTVVAAGAARTVEEIPRDGMLETQCAERAVGQSGCQQRRVVVTLPDSGQRAWLTNPPALNDPVPEPLPAADGSWWVTGKDPASGQWAVAVSRDSGRSWAIRALPATPDVKPDRLSFTGSGSTVYLLASGRLPDGLEPVSLVAIFQSVDGGGTWTRTWVPDGKAPRTIGGAVVTPDGGLFVALNDVGPGYRSLDGGRSFTPAFDGPRLTSIRRTRGGYLAMTSDSPGKYLSSVDGTRWSAVRLP
jgi:hypothetical protein